MEDFRAPGINQKEKDNKSSQTSQQKEKERGAGTQRWPCVVTGPLPLAPPSWSLKRLREPGSLRN